MDEGSQRFYAALAEHYDQLFPAEPEIVEFLFTAGARRGCRVLDLACGTGQYTQALLERGVDARGLDGSAELIRIARERTGRSDRFVVGDMRDAGSYPTGTFDLIFCIGNSVAHLASEGEVTEFFRTASGHLREAESRFVAQYVEMGSVKAGQNRQLPPLTTGTVSFERIYRRIDAESVLFDAVLRHKATGAQERVSNRLLATGDEMIRHSLRAAGYTDWQVWGGFDRQPPGGSWLRVVEAIR